jgi:hypothetical protein
VAWSKEVFQPWRQGECHPESDASVHAPSERVSVMRGDLKQEKEKEEEEIKRK